MHADDSSGAVAESHRDVIASLKHTGKWMDFMQRLPALRPGPVSKSKRTGTEANDSPIIPHDETNREAQYGPES